MTSSMATSIMTKYFLIADLKKLVFAVCVLKLFKDNHVLFCRRNFLISNNSFLTQNNYEKV